MTADCHTLSLPDICGRKHGGNEHSIAANRRAHLHKPLQRESVHAFITFMGAYGATSKEISQVLKMGYTSVSARLSELKEEGLIEENGQEREGAAAVVATGKNDAMPTSQPNAPLNADAAIQKELFTAGR